MFSTLIRQQARFVFSARLSSPLNRQSLCGLARTAPKHPILSQRAFSVSRSFSEEVPIRESFERNYDGKGQQFRRRRGPNRETKRSALYVGNLPFTIGEVDLRDMFESYGQIKRISLASDTSGRMTGYGFVEFENLDDAVAAVESGDQEPFVLFNRALKVGYAHNMHGMEQDAAVTPSATLHIANFPLPGEEAPLRRLMAAYEDRILRVNFMKNSEGSYTNKAFIQFSDQETATAALNAFQDYDFEGTVIKMSYARDRAPRRSRKMSDFDA